MATTSPLHGCARASAPGPGVSAAAAALRLSVGRLGQPLEEARERVAAAQPASGGVSDPARPARRAAAAAALDGRSAARFRLRRGTSRGSQARQCQLADRRRSAGADWSARATGGSSHRLDGPVRRIRDDEAADLRPGYRAPIAHHGLLGRLAAPCERRDHEPVLRAGHRRHREGGYAPRWRLVSARGPRV